MGYNREIIVIKKIDYNSYTATDLVNYLKETIWYPSLFVIDTGDGFNWIQLEKAENGELEFEHILKSKTLRDEYIGFTIINKHNNRIVTVNLNSSEIIFTLDIGKDDNESEWFEWYYNSLIKQSDELFEISSRIEFRSGYNNEVIETIE